MKTTKALLGILTLTMALIVQVQAQSFLTNGLVAYYPFNGNANDATAYRNNPSANTATLSSNHFGEPLEAYDFGPSKFVRYDNAPQLTFPFQTSVSAFAWAKFNNDLSGKFGGIISKMYDDRDPHRRGFQLGITWNKLIVELSSDAGQILFRDVRGTSVLNDGKWHAVGFVLDRTTGTARLFVDGKIDGTVVDASLLQDLSNTNSLMIGLERNSGGAFTGSIDSVRIYNRALSASEVQQLYAIESGPRVDLIKAVKPSFSNLTLTTQYQMQVSADMTTWTNQGAPFTATNTIMVYPQYWDVENWNSLFFRLAVIP